jgi:hypothetical protein
MAGRGENTSARGRQAVSRGGPINRSQGFTMQEYSNTRLVGKILFYAVTRGRTSSVQDACKLHDASRTSNTLTKASLQSDLTYFVTVHCLLYSTLLKKITMSEL